MTTTKYLEQLREVASNYDAISQELFRLSHKLEDMPMYNPENEIYSLVRSAELNTVNLRALAARVMSHDRNQRLNETISTALGISVEESHHWIKIVVPAILPNRNARDSTLFITRPLRHSLIEFQRENPIERFGSCVICIVHQYDEALGLRRIRDYDNIETKRYLDVIESIFLTNDSGLLCSVFQATEISDRDCTEFYLMPPDALHIWLKERQKTHT